MNNSENLAKLFSTAESTTDRFWEISLLTLGSMTWTQEQAETWLRKYLDWRKTALEEGTKFMEELTSQARANQQQIQKLIEDSVGDTFDNLTMPNGINFDDLFKKG